MNNEILKKPTLVVLSGGQDSTTCLAFAKKQGHAQVHAITFNYGQRHHREIMCASAIAAVMHVDSHEVVTLPAGILKSTSPLVSHEDLEQYGDFGEMEKTIGDRVEKTFVPMRNALFLTIAANRAVALDCGSIYTGVCEADNANYPDCTRNFIGKQQDAINFGLGYEGGYSTFPIDERHISILTPLISMTKAQSIDLMHNALDELALLALTHTAYDGLYPPLGRDHATVLRAQGFLEAGIPDPLIVRAVMEGRMPLPTTLNYAGQWDWFGASLTKLRNQINLWLEAVRQSSTTIYE